MSEEELSKRLARIQAKMKYMGETLSARINNESNTIESDASYSENFGSWYAEKSI